MSTSTHSHPAVGDKFVDLTGPVTIKELLVNVAMVSRPGEPPFLVWKDILMASARWQLHCPICKPNGCRDDDCQVCNHEEIPAPPAGK